MWGRGGEGDLGEGEGEICIEAYAYKLVKITTF